MDKLRLEWYRLQLEKMINNYRDYISISADDLGWLIEQIDTLQKECNILKKEKGVNT